MQVQLTTESVNLRKGPGTDYGIISKIMRGQTVEIILRSDDWCLVKVVGTDKVGYAYWPLLR